MPPLPTDLRRLLDRKVVEARDVAELAAAGALKSLAVDRTEPFAGMGEDDREFRRVLRARARQLGRFHDPFDASEGFVLLAAEIAYEQWHRMLFARFLAENGLLMHPEHGVAVTLMECAELAPQEDEPDEWMLAARFAAQMLPGIFRTTDPAVRVRFAPEGRQALERILAELPAEVFAADDSLGWVYQFWQTKKKKEVNASERKIGGADLPPVTQLFTEHYMVAFLLENSLGAWWAGRHPESPLLKEWEYLRFAEDGTPAAGTFRGWPERAAEVTMMDPCTGSAHFLVTGFHMIRRMREEEEGLSPREAADAVLRDNLFGLEIDGRCVQIAVFALALEAWKVGGYRELPPMNIACSGVSARGTAKDWRELAQGDSRLADALERLCHLFKDADSLGSLIDPRRAAEGATLFGVDYDDVAPLLHEALKRFGGDDPAQQVFAQVAEDVATAVKLLAGRYTLVATNPPYLGRSRQLTKLIVHADYLLPEARHDLSVMMLDRWMGLERTACCAFVIPQAMFTINRFEALRVRFLTTFSWLIFAVLGGGAFESISGEVVNVALGCWGSRYPAPDATIWSIGKSTELSVASSLTQWPLRQVGQSTQLANPQCRITFVEPSGLPRLSEYASTAQGIATSDSPRFVLRFWEIESVSGGWELLQSAPESTVLFGGQTDAIFWEDGHGVITEVCQPRATFRGQSAWGKRGVVVSQMYGIPAALYTGERFDGSGVAIVPNKESTLLPLWAFVSSDVFRPMLRQLDPKLRLANATFQGVPFDLDHWTEVAAEQYPSGLPEPHSNDPTQWLFKGKVVGSETPLHVAVARLLGYSWPDQEPDELDHFSDSDGIVCLPPVGGERPATDRLRELLAAAYGDSWSHSFLEGLLAAEASPDLEAWLREKYFVSHCSLFGNRPFIWQIWDGQKDGFSALVNCHKLDRKLLDRLIYSTLQSWIDRQKAGVDQQGGGAEERLIAAAELKRKLQLIAEGEPPYDIYVRWKPLERQPIGWDPDINDGVRLNIRPFVEAGVLRSKFTVNWNKDRGKNPDGSERLNNMHFTVAQKREARAQETSG